MVDTLNPQFVDCPRCGAFFALVHPNRPPRVAPCRLCGATTRRGRVGPAVAAAYRIGGMEAVAQLGKAP